MKIIEAINHYRETKDKDSLYEAIYFSGLKENEVHEVLKDTLKENYSKSEYNNFLAKIRENFSRGNLQFKIANTEWEQAYGVSMEELLRDDEE